MELDSLTEYADYIPGELIWIADYFSNVGYVKAQGLAMAAAITFVIFFKVLDKFKAPTEKPIKKDKTVIQNVTEMFRDLKFAILAKMVYTVDLLISLSKRKPKESKVIEIVCSECGNKFPTFEGDTREICENCRFPIT